MPISQQDIQPFLPPPTTVPGAGAGGGGVASLPPSTATSPQSQQDFLNSIMSFFFGGNSGPTTLQNQSGQPPTKTGTYYGIPVYDPSSGQVTSQTGAPSSGNWGLLSGIDPLGLFGGKGQPSWNQYIQNGQYYFANPKNQNPVPLANVPGAPLKPSKNYQNTAANTQAISDMLPYLNAAVNQGAVPTAQAQLAAQQATSPGYAELMTSLFNTYGPQLNAIGNEINQRNALSQASTENAVLTGPGKDLVSNAYGLSQIYDKPYYDTRAAGAKSIQDLLGSIDLSGGLSPTERDEIAKGLARTDASKGLLNAPSQTNAVSNAMQFGQAGYQRQQQAKSNLTAAIQAASGFLPASKSGVDVFQVATGRPSAVNQGAAQFPGVTGSTNTQGQFGLAGSMLGGLNNADINAANIQANKKDWLDQFNQFTSGLSNLTSTAGSAAGILCWVAREVYGSENPRWKVIRNWLFEKAPVWLFNLYLQYGERVAKFIRNKPILKSIIRKIMDYVK